MLADLDAELDAVPGTVSIWFGGADGSPRHARHGEATHYAASTMKVAVMAAAYRLADEGAVDLHAPITVHNSFASAAGAVEFANDPGYDNDPEPWQRLGQTSPLHWLIRRMIIRSSNLSTNLVLERVGFDAVRDVWSSVNSRYSATTRGIEDYAAREAGMSNVVTAADLASLLVGIRSGALAGSDASAAMIGVLRAQEANEPLCRGLPHGVVVASKSGWVDGIRHSMAIVTPDDAPEFVLTTCVSADPDGAMPDDAIANVITRVTAAAWNERHPAHIP